MDWSQTTTGCSQRQVITRSLRNGVVLFVGAVVTIGTVTALLNLDTSVAFLTPVLIYTARSRGEGEAPLLYGCLLLSNAGSLLLPGSNLTNLIVLGHLHLTGGEFFAHMWVAALAALVATAIVIAVVERRSLHTTVADLTKPPRPVIGVGLAAVAVATVLVVVLPSPAPFVVAVGVAAIGIRLCQRRDDLKHVISVLGVPVLVGLFGLAVALGTVGHTWSGPATLLSHLDQWGTAAVGVVAALLFQQPAGSLSTCRAPSRPSLRPLDRSEPRPQPLRHWLPHVDPVASSGTKRRRAAHPSRATRLGLIVVPMSMAIAVGALTLTGSH